MTDRTEKIALEQAHYVLKNLDVERPGCGYLKLANACRAAAQGDTRPDWKQDQDETTRIKPQGDSGTKSGET